MRTSILCLLLFAIPTAVQVEKYFSDGSLHERPDMHEHRHARYAEAFKAFGEPSLLSLAEKENLEGVEIYRFTWLRSFHKPVCITARIETAKVALTVKVLDGKGGYEVGKVATEKKLDVAYKNFKPFLSLLDEAEYRHMVVAASGQGDWFWDSDRKVWIRAYRGGKDGATWMLEYCTAGRYFFAERWSPSKSRFGKACLQLLLLAWLDKEEVY
jgi:hypothetical protein